MERARIEDVGYNQSFEEQQAKVNAVIQSEKTINEPTDDTNNKQKVDKTLYMEELPRFNDETVKEVIQSVKAVPKGDENELLEKAFDKRLTEEEINLLAEEGGKRGVNELFSGEGIALKTELNQIETVRFSQLLFMANRYQIAGIDHFVNNLLQLKVSLARKGRTEFIQGLHAEERRMMGQDMSPIQALMSKLGGG